MTGDWYQIRQRAGTKYDRELVPNRAGAGTKQNSGWCQIRQGVVSYTTRAGAIHDGGLVLKARGWCQLQRWASAKYERWLVPNTTGFWCQIRQGQVPNKTGGWCQIGRKAGAKYDMGLVPNTKGDWCFNYDGGLVPTTTGGWCQL